MITAVTNDPIYRELAEQVLHGACDAVDIELAGVEFGERDGVLLHGCASSWTRSLTTTLHVTR